MQKSQSAKRPVRQANSSNSKSATVASVTSGAKILTAPYPLVRMGALFKEKYADSIGYSMQAAQVENVRHLRMSPIPINRAIECLGFTKVDEDMSDCIVADDSKLSWAMLTSKDTELPCSGPGFMIMKPFVGRMYLMCNKWLLVESLRSAEERMRKRRLSFRTGSGELFSHREFIPLTINMNSPTLERDLAEYPGTYLSKPARGTMGERMQLVRVRADHVNEDLLSFLVGSEYLEMRRSQVILQRYVERPLLIDKRKFDMRVYMLVVNPKRGDGSEAQPSQSGYFAFLHPGFVRLCSSPYDPDHADLAVHLTNQSVQAKNASAFRRLKEVTTWYPDELNDYLNRRRRVSQDWAKDVLYPKIGAILGYIASVFRHLMDDRDCPTCTFRILGVDMLVDDQLRVYLLEFNELPAWGRQTSVLESIKPNLWREAICLISELAVRYKAYLAIDDENLVTRRNFRIIYSSEDPKMSRRNIARLYS